jgi:hypothetical protein
MNSCKVSPETCSESTEVPGGSPVLTRQLLLQQRSACSLNELLQALVILWESPESGGTALLQNSKLTGIFLRHQYNTASHPHNPCLSLVSCFFRTLLQSKALHDISYFWNSESDLNI